MRRNSQEGPKVSRLEKIVVFDYHRFGNELRFIRRNQKKRTQRATETETGVGRETICKIEGGRLRDSICIVLLAFWADLDLRDYVDVKEKKITQPTLL